MKTVDDIRAKLGKRYDAIWANEVTGTGESEWPYTVPVGLPGRTELESRFSEYDRACAEIEQWAKTAGLTCKQAARKVGHMSYTLTTHVVASDIDALAHAAGQDGHLKLWRYRADALAHAFPEAPRADVRRAIVLLNRDGADDVDFELCVSAAQWFAAHETHDLTPREVPLEGFHAKWLDSLNRRAVVCLLSGRNDLGLKERPRLVRFRYLDPAYLESGQRVHDSLVEGDACALPYKPATVIICENRDSALWFPSITLGIAVLGDGKAQIPTLSRIKWITDAKKLFYWGDMDTYGLEILAKYRESGLCVKSLFMDMPAYERYERFGTNVDRHGHVLTPLPNASALDGLTAAENELYLHLCATSCSGPRRIEQERIPLSHVQAQLSSILSENMETRS